MKKEKAYELLSQLLDNELKPDARLKVLKVLETDSWWQQEYEKLKTLKFALASHSPQLSLSSDFDSSLREKIYDMQNTETWISRLRDYSIMSKLAYGMVTASVIFLGFIGFKALNQQNHGGTAEMAISRVSGFKPTSTLSPASASPVPVSTTSIAILEPGGHLKVVKGNHSIRLNLLDPRPDANLDSSTRKIFKDTLNHVEYFRGILFKRQGDTRKSQVCFKNYLSNNPDSQLAQEIKENELDSLESASTVSHDK